MHRSVVFHRLVGAGVFLAVLVVYLRTMAPSVSFWDCGEFIACSYSLAVPHPPGAPLYILLGRLFSLLPFGEPAWRITLMSALSSALAAWCVYLSTVALARRALGGEALRPFGDSRDFGVVFGAAAAALSLAFSYTFWFNATEAEVYGYSIFFACLGIWLILYWEGALNWEGSTLNDRWLYFIAYLFGLGGGIHLLCLLTLPSILILAWFADARLRRLILLLLGLGVWGLVSLAMLGPGADSDISIVLGLLAVLLYLYQNDRRSCWLLLGSLLLFGLAYSTYASLYIRSGLNPAIDENDPETLGAFIKFLNREQYGTDSQLLGMFAARASRTYQFWHQQMKYFFQQFPFPLLEHTVVFRRTTENSPYPISVSLLPYLLGLGGMLWHAGRDWKRFAAILAMFVIMGFGLSLYLNMPDPQPRERHYVFGGMFYAFALWMGLGWTAAVEALRRRLSLRPPLVAAVACLGLLLPIGISAKLYHLRDRTGNYIAYDYAYNILNSCEPGSILFTNGDNDTFPLWFLQEVESIRRDVRVVNLSLLNTNWYIKQLRDREPRIHIPLSDTYIDSVLTDTQKVDLYRRLWRQPKIPKEFKELGLEAKVSAPPGYDLLRVQDVMVIGIVRWNAWKRPIHFAITVAGNARAGLEAYLRMVGMTMRLVPERDLGPDGEAMEHNLYEVYRFRGLTDPGVHKDLNTRRLLGNYRACVMQLAEIYQKKDQGEKMAQLFRWAEDKIPMGWESYYSAGDYLSQAGQRALAAEYTERAGNMLADSFGDNPNATYHNLLALAGLLLETYGEPVRAERLYRRAIAEDPQDWEGYYELAATLQAKGDVAGALQVLRQHRERYGEVDTLRMAEEILLKAQSRAAAGSSATQP